MTSSFLLRLGCVAVASFVGTAGAQQAGGSLFDFGSLPSLGEPRSETPRFQDLDRIVAIVNEEVVVESELDERIFTVVNQLRANNTRVPEDNVLREQVLERVIVEKLQLQAAGRLGIRIDDAALNEALASIAQRNNMSLTQFREALVRERIDIAAYRETIRDEMRIAQLQEREIGNRVRVTPRDIDNYLASSTGSARGAEQARLREILVALPQGPSPEAIAEARASAEQILAELRGGADFVELVVSRSDGREALDGGNLGLRPIGELPRYLAEAASSLEPGQVSEMIRSANGFHIVRLEERRDGGGNVVVQSRVRHILMQPGPELSNDEARRRMELLRQRILVNGEAFDSLARAHSQDSTSALRGGDIGWVTPGDVVPQFQKVVDELSPGSLSEPFETRFGWHVLEVLDRREYDNSSEASRARATERIRARKIDEEMGGWIRQLRDEAYVELRLDPL